MAVEHFIIDGYNLLWRGFNFQFGGRDLASQRQMMEVQLKEYLRHQPEARLILVYDGALFVDDPPRRLPPQLEIIYSKPPQTADQLVLEKCRKQSNSSFLTVVTSDAKDIVSQLQRLGLRHRSSEDFAMDLEAVWAKRRRPPRTAPAKPVKRGEKPRTISAEEVEEWMQIFSKPKKNR